MQKKHRVYYYVTYINGHKKWIRLSDDYQKALYKYADLEGNPQNTGLVGDTIDRYSAEILPSLSKKTIETRQYQLKKLKNVFAKSWYRFWKIMSHMYNCFQNFSESICFDKHYYYIYKL